MTPSDLDLPLLPSAEQIRRKEFATVRRGYDIDQVRDYLVLMATQIETLEEGLREAKMQAATRPAPSPGEVLAGRSAEADAVQEGSGAGIAAGSDADPYTQLAERLASVLRSADQEAAEVLDSAKEEATRLVEDARTEADSVRLDAQARAEEARQQGAEALARAKAEADETLGRLAERRGSLVAQMQEMQSRLLSVARDIEGAIDRPDGAGAPKIESDAPTGSEAKMEPGAPTEASDETDTGARDETERSEVESSAEDVRPARPRTVDEEPFLDPRYEDLWVSKDPTVGIPDLASMELDFDDDARD